MTIELTLFVTQVNNLIPNIPTTGEVAAINIRQQIKQAVIDYSRDKPDMVTEDEVGDGGRYYAISALAAWSDELSSIISIQYPAPTVASDETPVYLDTEDWQDDYYDGSTRYIFFPNHSPAATESFRVRYYAPYIWTAGTTTTAVAQAAHGFSVNDYVYLNSAGTWVDAGTENSANLLATHIVSAVADSSNFTAKILATNVPDFDFFAVCNKAACLICQEIATHYSRTSDSTIAADVAGHTERGREFAARAKDFCARYADHLGLSKGDGGAAVNLPRAEFVDLDNAPGWPVGRQFVFHDRRTR